MTNPLQSNGSILVYQGATYDSDESRALVFSIVGASDLTGATVALLFSWGVDSLSVTGATSNEGAATQTASLPSSGVSYSLTAVLANTHIEPLQTGRVIVIPSLPAN